MREILDTFRPNLFAGKRVLVSGASTGIGLAIARCFAGLGAEVIATGSSPDKLATARADASNAGIRFETLDVRDRAAVDAFVGALPGLDVLVNTAGIARPEAEWDEETYLDVIDVNLNSAMRLSVAARPLLKASGDAVVPSLLRPTSPVLTVPGSTIVTPIPKPFTSAASDSKKASHPHLVAQ